MFVHSSRNWKSVGGMVGRDRALTVECTVEVGPEMLRTGLGGGGPVDVGRVGQAVLVQLERERREVGGREFEFGFMKFKNPPLPTTGWAKKSGT